MEVRATIKREALHPSITEEQISGLVDSFYGKVLNDEFLGPVFRRHVDGEWDKHLEKMKAFWRSVLLRTGEYKGKPVPVHQNIPNINTDMFITWLHLFSSTTTEIFCPEAAALVREAAQRIATSLWLSRSSDPFISPPAWPAYADQPAA